MDARCLGIRAATDFGGSVGTGDDLQWGAGEMSSMEGVRGTILNSGAGMKKILADLKHTEAESLKS